MNVSPLEQFKKIKFFVKKAYSAYISWLLLHEKERLTAIGSKELLSIITSSLHDNFLLSLAKIFDNNDAVFSYKDILKLVSAEKKQDIMRHEKRIDSYVQNLYIWRNKSLSHSDKIYVFDPKSLEKEHSLSIENIEAIFNFLLNMLTEVASTLNIEGDLFEEFQQLEDDLAIMNFRT